MILAATSLLVAGTCVFSAQPSFAVHDTGQFELDGNIANNGNAVYDWADLFNADGSRKVIPDPNSGPLLASEFNSDATDPDKTYFSSNKDIEPIANWGCTTINNPTPKDDLQNAYAALIQIPANAPDNAGHKVLYLASERQSNNGDSFAGFWLLKNKSVGCSGSGSFAGTHTDGDILVLSNYTNGGGTQDVQVYRWTGNDATGAPVAVAGLSGSTCGAASPDSACAIANSSTITSPWTPTSHPSNTFVEAGIDLNNLLDATGGGCFTNFLAESRSSQQITATLKDFAGGQFNTCPPAPLTTTATPGGSSVARGTAQHDVATLTAAGSRPTPTGSVDFYLCQPAEVTAEGCPTGGTKIGSSVTVANGSATSADTTSTTTNGKYCWRAEYTPDATGALSYLASTHTNATTECFTVVHASPALTTQISPAQSSGALGLTTLGDTATLTGFVPGTVTGESVAFKLYGPFATGVTPTCTGTAVFSTTGTLSAAGVATTAASYTPTQAGTYVWQASYAGDTYNDAVSDACNETNEKITIIGATIDVTKSADLGTVSAGDPIGFTITAENKGSIPALGTVITDALPAGADLNWTIDPANPACSITGAQGSQVLTCTVGTLGALSSFPVHITSPTTPADCGTVNNKATVTTTNGTGGDSDVASIKVNCAQLSLIKTADAASVNAGSSIGFTVTASNSSAAGTGTAHTVVISDPLPTGSGINWSIDSQTSNKCSIAGTAPAVQTVNCAIGDLAPGSTYSFHVTSSTVFASCGDYKNVATLSASNANSIEKTANTSVLCSSLSLTKTADHQAPVDAGSQIGFTITAANTGSGSATGVVINDTLPAGVTWSIASGPANCSIPAGLPQILTCTAVTLAEGQTESVHIVASTTYANCAAYVNTATLTSTNSPSPAPASATETVNCPDLSLTKVADDETVDAGSPIGFTVTVTNSSDAAGTATGVVINDPLPSGTGISWSVDDQSGLADCTVTGTAPNQSLSCASVTLAPGESESVHVTSSTTYLACAAYSNTVTLTGTSNHPGATASASTTVQCPNVSISKTADSLSVDAGQDIGFTVTVTNAGPGAATDVALNDPLPLTPGLTWTIESGPDGCQIIDGEDGSQTLVCAPTGLGAEDSFSVHVVAGTVFTNCGTYDNTATFTATNAPGGNASASTEVLCPDVSLVKSADATSVNAGESIGFSVTVSNSSAENVGTATGVTVHDPLPGGSGVSWSIDTQTVAGESSDSCSISGDAPDQVLDCSGVTLAPGESETVHITSATSFASCQAYDNTASAAVVNGMNPEDSSASVDVLCSALAVTKTADAADVTAGSPIGFTITATNTGAGTASNATLTDKLPAGVDADWSISPDYAGPGTCAVSGAVGDQTLTCQLGDLGPEATAEVHVVSATTASISCGTLDNTVVLDAGNAPSESASASTTVGEADNCLGISSETPTPTPTTPVPSTSSGVEPVAATGAGPLGAEIGWAAVLLGLGIALLAFARRRRPGGNHTR